MPRDAHSEGWEWTCPYCERSRVNISTGEDGEKNAIAALRTHIMASDGAEHGPRNEFPAHLEGLELTDYVVKIIK